MAGIARVERLGTEGIGKLLAEMSTQTTFSLLVYAIYSITDTYFLSVGVNSLAAAGASIISPVLIALGGVATIMGVGGASVVFAVCAICLVIPGVLIGMLSREPAIIIEGQKALRMLSLAYPLSGVAVMVAAYFQSLGKAKDALLLTLGGMLLVMLPVLLLGARLFGLNGIWASEAVSELILCAVALLMLRYTQARAAWRWSPEQA